MCRISAGDLSGGAVAQAALKVPPGRRVESDYLLSVLLGGVDWVSVAGVAAGVAWAGLAVELPPDVGLGTDGGVGWVSMGILVTAGASGTALCLGKVTVGPSSVGLTVGSVLDISGFGAAISDLGVVSGAGTSAGAGASGRSDFKALAIDVYDALAITNVPSLPCKPTYRSSSLPRV